MGGVWPVEAVEVEFAAIESDVVKVEGKFCGGKDAVVVVENENAGLESR